MQITECEAAVRASKPDLDEAETISTSGVSVQQGVASGGTFKHVSIAAKHKAITFESLEVSNSGDRAFNRFCLRLAGFLSMALPTYDIPLKAWIKFEPTDKACTLD